MKRNGRLAAGLSAGFFIILFMAGWLADGGLELRVTPVKVTGPAVGAAHGPR